MSSPCRAYRDAIYEQLARLTKAMAHPKRLMMLDLLVQAPRTVEVLADRVAMSVASASQHLQVLRAARLVEAEKNGLYVTYRLADETVYTLLQDLRLVAQHRLAEVEQLRRQVAEERGHLGRLKATDVRECLREGDAVVLDVRPAEEYQAGHLPGAVPMPLDELENRLAELPKDRPIVAYCRGQYCLMARQAVDLLQRHGYDARYVEEGLRELQAAGVAVETA
ncbi:metalloregulator ArsR/SmtB family transcription factor [bacterium]|nr:metalloregulator ArsR/SmtB family transcription factor [bacterium]